MHLLLMIYPVMPSDEEPTGIRTLLKAADIRSEVSINVFSMKVRTQRWILQLESQDLLPNLSLLHRF
jgi:hypothetical protein